MQADLSDLYTVDGNFPFGCLQKTEQTQCHGGLACAGPTHNANLQTHRFSKIKKKRYIYGIYLFMLCFVCKLSLCTIQCRVKGSLRSNTSAVSALLQVITDLFSSFHLERNVPQHQVKPLPIPHTVISKRHVALRRPVR